MACISCHKHIPVLAWIQDQTRRCVAISIQPWPFDSIGGRFQIRRFVTQVVLLLHFKRGSTRQDPQQYNGDDGVRVNGNNNIAIIREARRRCLDETRVRRLGRSDDIWGSTFNCPNVNNLISLL